METKGYDACFSAMLYGKFLFFMPMIGTLSRYRAIALMRFTFTFYCVAKLMRGRYEKVRLLEVGRSFTARAEYS